MKLITDIFKSKKKKSVNTKSPLEKSDQNIQIGRFDLNSLPDEYNNKSCYLEAYSKDDGQWIEKGELICEIRIGDYSTNKVNSASVFAVGSGILEQTFQKKQLLPTKGILYKLHKKGSYVPIESVEKGDSEDVFNGNHLSYSFDKWLKSDGDYVEKGDGIYQIIDPNYNRHINHAKRSGYLHISDPEKRSLLNENELMYVIRDDDKQRIDERYINEPNFITDEFNNSQTIEWNRVSSKYQGSYGIISKADNFILDLIFSFNFIHCKDYVVLHFNPKQIKPKQYDKVSFLFSNDHQIEIELTRNPTSLKNNQNEGVLEYKSIITKSELELFVNADLKKWKISLTNDNREILGGDIGGDIFYNSKYNLQLVIKKYASEYVNLVQANIPNYKPTEIRESTTFNEPKITFCYVYLMLDTANGYYKIGISNKPKYRERTLQSEKPSIEMIASKKFPIRKIAEAFEKSLHEAFSQNRVRGEWFEFDATDVKHIKEALK